MARKRKPSKTRKASRKSTRATLPKWQREGFRTYRAYLDERFKAFGFKSFADYTKKRVSGQVPPIKTVRGKSAVLPGRSIGPMPANVKKQLLIVSRQPPPVGILNRITYDAPCPIEYGITDFVGDAIVAWLRGVFAHIEAEAAAENRKIFSGTWRLFGEIARELDDDGNPVFDKGLKEEYSSHMDWPKCKQTLLDLAKEYGNHGFIEHGKLIGRSKGGTDSYIYVFLIKSVRISISYPSADIVPPEAGGKNDDK